MTFEQIESKLIENKRLQRKLIRNMAKNKTQFATILDLISITTHQEELELKREEEIEALRISIRKQISEKSNGIYTNLPVPLRYLAGELLVGNEEYVLNKAIHGNGQTIAAETIMITGFTTNQAEILSLQMKQLNTITRSFEEARLDSDKIKEVNFIVGAMDGDTLKHTRSLVVLANDRAGKLAQHQIRLEMYEDHVKDFCKSCQKPQCTTVCPLYIFCGWSKI